MFPKQSFQKARLWIAVMLLAGSLLQARAAAPPPVVLPDSIKPVEQSSQTGAINPQKPFISRSVLRADEIAAPLDFEVALKMRNFSELQARVARGERISPQEMAVRYEPTTGDYQTVVDWLTSQGLTITRQDNHHMAVFARGTIGQIQQALKVTFARVTFAGKEYTSAITAPSVPVTLSPILLGINGLQPHLRPHKHLIKQQVHPNASGGGTASYLPKQIAQAYNATALYNTNISGSGQTIAIVIDTFPDTNDLVSFWKTAGVSQSIGNIQFIQAVSGQLPPPSGEETLDVEWSSSIAPGAHVRVYAATDLANADLDQTYQQVYDDVINHPELGIHQMSMSFGQGESYTTDSQMQTDDQYFAELATAGVTVFASSGDDGSTPGSNGTGDESGPVQPENPASDPNVTGVGGTTLILNSNNNETSEVVWNDGGSGGASGGAISTYFSRPSWQTGTGVPTGTNRCVPDVACSADPNYGAVVIQGGVQQTVGGTSWSSPTWAAFCALINQARATAGQASLGLFGPQIYPLLNSSNYPANYLANFRDITSGNNATNGSGGKYAATAGYDLCTGLGVPLMQTLTQLQVGSSTLVGVQMPSAVQEVAPGQNATFTVTVGGSSATYQWQRMPVGSSTWTTLSNTGAYSGWNTATLTITNATTAMSGDQFQCLVNLGSSMVTTAPPSVLVVDTPLIVTTLAGQVGTTGLKNGSGTAAQFDYPSAIAADTSGNLYIADYGNNQIREITPGGAVSTPYGSLNGTSGSTNGAGNTARFNSPNGVAADSSNNLYVADTGNNIIREISGGTVSTLAGTSNQFSGPEGIAVDGSGNVYVADTGNDTIREISPSGVVSILAGQTGIAGYADGGATTQALFNGPTSVAVDGLGNVYVADFNNSVIRKISSGTVTTVAGQAGQAGYLDGLAANALFNAPVGLAVDSSDNLYIADSLVPYTGNSTGNNLVRRLTPAGVVSTIAGQAGVTGSANGTGAGAAFNSLQAVAYNATSGLLYLADTYNQTIRMGSTTPADIISLSGNLAFGNVTVNTTSTSSLTISNSGNTALTVSSINYPVGFSGNWPSGTIAAGGSQTVTVTFAPTSAVSYSGNITVNSNASSGTGTIAVSGMGVIPVTQTISLSGNLAFGSVMVNQTASNILTISNTGNTSFTVTSIGYPAGFSGDWSSGSIAGGGSQNVTVTFAPTSAASYGGNITVYSNATLGNNTIATSGAGLPPPAPPLATTSSATMIGAVSATLNGTTNPKGSATTVSFQYGTTTLYGNTTTGQSAGGGTTTVSFSTPISGLAPQTTYYYRTVATNAGGTVYGAAKSLKTLAAPAFGATPAAYLGASGAEVGQTVNPDGVATSVYFQYSTNASFSTFLQTVPQNIGSGKAPVNVFALFPGLSPSTPYYYQMVTTSAAGTFYGPQETFTTLPFDTALVTQKGASAAEAGGTTFASFGNPAVNVNDDVAFAGTLTTGVSGIWADDNAGTQQLITQIGSAAPGTSGTFLTLSDPVYNNNEAVAFRGTLTVATGQATSTTAAGIWEGASAADLALVARQGSQAPGCPTGATFSTFTSLGLADSGNAIILATLNASTAAGVTTSNNIGIWEGNSTANLALVLRTGGTVGGKTITKLVFLPTESYVNGQTRSFNSTSGDIVCGATFSDTTTGIVTVGGGMPSIVFLSGTSAAGITGATFASFGNPAINTNDDVAFAATLTTGAGEVTTATNAGIWAETSSGILQLVAQSGSGVAPGTTANFLTFSDPVYNNNEAVAFRATLKVATGQATSTTETGIWCNSTGSLALVAQQGGQAPGCPAGTTLATSATFSAFTELALADQGGVMMLATLNANTAAGVGKTNNLGIWAVDTTGTLQLIVRTGDLLNGKTVTGLAFLPAETYVNGQSRSFAQGTGDLVYLATFSDKSTGIFNVVFP